MFTKFLNVSVCLRGGVCWRTKKKCGPKPSKVQGKGSFVSPGKEGWQRWRIDVPPRKRREGRLWKPPVSQRCAYALNTDGCRVVSGMCQEAWTDFDISEIMLMVHFYRLWCTIHFTGFILQAQLSDIHAVSRTFQKKASVIEHRLDIDLRQGDYVFTRVGFVC